MGAARIVPRAELAEISTRPLEKESWAGCIDSVGGPMLARILGQMNYGSSVAAVGLAGGSALPTSDLPGAKIEAFTRTIGLMDVPDIGAALLEGRSHGRYVVDLLK